MELLISFVFKILAFVFNIDFVEFSDLINLSRMFIHLRAQSKIFCSYQRYRKFHSFPTNQMYLNHFHKSFGYSFNSQQDKIDPEEQKCLIPPVNGSLDDRTFQQLMDYIISDKLYSNCENEELNRCTSNFIQFLKHPQSMSYFKCFNELGSHGFQYWSFKRFQRYFPTSKIQDKFYRAVIDPKNYIFHFTAPWQIGMSHNLAIFSALLRTSERYNVIYIHNFNCLLDFTDDFLQSLIITLPPELKMQLIHLNHKQLNKIDFRAELIKILNSNKKQIVLLIDDPGEIIDNQNCFFLNELLVLLEFRFSKAKIIIISQANDYKVRFQQEIDVIYQEVQDQMSDNQANEFVHYLARINMKEQYDFQLIEEYMERIIKITGKMPGQINSLFQTKSDQFELRLSEYLKKSTDEVFKWLSLRVYYKTKHEVNQLRNELTQEFYEESDKKLFFYYSKLREAIETSQQIQINSELKNLTDRNYLYMTKSKVYSLFPAVNFALDRFIKPELRIELLNEAFIDNNATAFAFQFKQFIKERFDPQRNSFFWDLQPVIIIKHQDETNKQELEQSTKMTFYYQTPIIIYFTCELEIPEIHRPLLQTEDIDSNSKGYLTIYYPYFPNQNGINFIMVCDDIKEVFVFHINLEFELLNEWSDTLDQNDQVENFKKKFENKKYKVNYVFCYLFEDCKNLKGEGNDRLLEKIKKLKLTQNLWLLDATQFQILKRYKRGLASHFSGRNKKKNSIFNLPYKNI